MHKARKDQVIILADIRSTFFLECIRSTWYNNEKTNTSRTPLLGTVKYYLVLITLQEHR
jgi:hypothetical protein